MTEEEALKVLEEVLGNFQLNKIQKIVFRQVWAGQSYMQIASNNNYEYSYIKDVGYELWRCISTVLGEKVTKHNVERLLKCYSSQHHINQGLIKKHTQQSSNSNQYIDPQSELKLLLSIQDQETRWTGRSSLIKTLTQKLHGNCHILNIVGITGIGKSSLSIRLSLEPSIEQSWSKVIFIQCDHEANTFEKMARQLLGEQITQNEEFRKNPAHLIECMVGQLKSSPILLIIDMVEELLVPKDTVSESKRLQKSYKYTNSLFLDFFERFLTSVEMPSRLILTSQILPPIIADGRYDSRIHSERLSGLTDVEALQLFNFWDIQLDSESDEECLQKFIRAYEGHPLALKVIAGEIREIPYKGNIQAYWHEYGAEIKKEEEAKKNNKLDHYSEQTALSNYSLKMTDLVERLVEKVLERLRQVNVLAYNLLCMGSVYRCSVERSGWILMIDDSPKQEQLIAWQTLQRRFLLEENIVNNKIYYRLHSLIKSVASHHLSQM